jgi:Glycosyltransferase family 87
MLGLLAFAYYVRGARYLVLGTEVSDAVDLKLRWSEERYFLKGQNPFDMWLAHSPIVATLGLTEVSDRPAAVDASLGVSDPALPPWGYVSALALLWPEWPGVRIYYLLLNTVALAFMAWWASSTVMEAGRLARWLLGLSVIAIGSVSSTLGVGQFGILVTALLCAACYLERQNRPLVSGLFVAFALVKPTLAGPFFLAMVIRRRWPAVFSCAAYLTVCSIVTWVVVATPPWEMLRQLLRVGAVIGDQGSANLASVLIGMVEDRRLATMAAMLIGLAPMALLLISRIGQESNAAYAVAAVVSRMWTYHKTYDDIILAFVLIGLGAYALKKHRVDAASGAMFVILGVTLWLPPRIVDTSAVSAVRTAICLVSLTVLMIVTCRSRAHEALRQG